MAIRYNKEIIKKDRTITTRGPRDLQNRTSAVTNSDQSELISFLKEEISRLTHALDSKSTTTSQESSPGLYTEEQVNDEIVKALTSETSQLKLEYERVVKNYQLEAVRLENDNQRLNDENTSLRQQLLHLKEINTSDISNITENMKLKYEALLLEKESKLRSDAEVHQMELRGLKDKLSEQETLINSLKELKNTSSSNTEERLVSALTEATKKLEEMAKSIPNSSTFNEQDNRPQIDTVFVDPSESTKDVLESNITIEDVSHKRKEDMASKVNKLKSLMGSLPNKR